MILSTSLSFRRAAGCVSMGAPDRLRRDQRWNWFQGLDSTQQKNLQCRSLGYSLGSSYGEMTNSFQKFISLTRALSDPTRVRMLLVLRRRELCVCQITALFGLAPSTVSKHLSVLQQAGLVRSRKSDRWVYYRLPDRTAPVVVREALDWVWKSVSNTDEAALVRERLSKILKVDPNKICRGRWSGSRSK